MVARYNAQPQTNADNLALADLTCPLVQYFNEPSGVTVKAADPGASASHPWITYTFPPEMEYAQAAVDRLLSSLVLQGIA